MENLKFYEIDPDYMDYLRHFEPKVPNNVKNGNSKPYCGIVLSINGFNYYAPVSSFNQSQFTNFPIKDIDDNNNEFIISTVRFCYMVPAPNEVLTLKNFSTNDYKYNGLLSKELSYCQKPDNRNKIRTKAQKIRNLKPTHAWYSQCCDFNLLENLCASYTKKLCASTSKELQYT